MNVAHRLFPRLLLVLAAAASLAATRASAQLMVTRWDLDSVFHYPVNGPIERLTGEIVVSVPYSVTELIPSGDQIITVFGGPGEDIVTPVPPPVLPQPPEWHLRWEGIGTSVTVGYKTGVFERQVSTLRQLAYFTADDTKYFVYRQNLFYGTEEYPHEPDGSIKPAYAFTPSLFVEFTEQFKLPNRFGYFREDYSSVDFVTGEVLGRDRWEGYVRLVDVTVMSPVPESGSFAWAAAAVLGVVIVARRVSWRVGARLGSVLVSRRRV